MGDDLQCPHCGETAIITSENPELIPWGDGDDSDINCQNCNRELTVCCEVVRVRHYFVDELHDEIEFEEPGDD